jgi:crotonobetainyl-CoA:carnitine CoA-transferase CaiB-like acyl-CoA transferase
MMGKPLSGMKILDFTYLLPGPFGTMMLADLGAEIIKVENPVNPDLMRLVPPFVDGMSAAYAQVNRGKKSVALNLTFPEAGDIVRRLIGEYDIVIEQFRPGVMDKFGLGYDALRDVNPKLIYCSLTGYGQTGSFARRAGHDINYMALAGIESFSGRKETGPVLGGVQVADLGGGSKNLCIAVMAACIRRLTTGEGEYCDISITDGAFSLSVFQAAGFLAGAPEPAREEDVLNGGSLYDFYRTADGRYLSVGPIEPKFLLNFLNAVGMGDLLCGGVLSPEQAAGAKNEIARAVASKPLAHWIGVFRGTDACVEPVRTLGEALANPPISEREMVIVVPGEGGTEFRQIANPIRFASGPCNAGCAGAGLGRHTDEVLAGAGYAPGEVARLREKGVAV